MIAASFCSFGLATSMARGTVHAGNLGPVQLADHVVDRRRDERRQQVLDGMHLRRAVLEAGAPRRVVNEFDARRNLRLPRQIHAAEDDARADVGRTQTQCRRLAGMEADAVELRGGAESPLRTF